MRPTIILTLVGVAVVSFTIFKSTAATTPPQAQSQTEVRANVPPSSPLQISISHIGHTASGYPYLEYTITNTGTQRLTAVEVVWEARFPNAPFPQRIEQREDNFFAPDGALAPGSSETERVSLPLRRGSPTALASVDGSIGFAEFADGTRIGPDQAKVSLWLRQLRTAVMAEYQKLFSEYRSGGQSGLETALKSQDPSDSAVGAGTRRSLLKMQERQGLTAVVNRIDQVVSLKLPN